ncbi:gamma-glutamylcyclotransferase 2-3-like [Andrographis paniculata]|uniref:gamma-glutamylcyclotransferase 2-3-like n=1 Tax=Andrographis paniculata TaxID=175694 RepID=UPI0021E87F74|nr:gamma-glutamylcyclotransferase 2-3-like [Andrographis paniculata]
MVRFVNKYKELSHAHTETEKVTSSASGLHLEVKEKQYDKKVLCLTSSLYIGSADKKLIVNQIDEANGPSGPNMEYLFKLENALKQIGCEDKHVFDLAIEVRQILSQG